MDAIQGAILSARGIVPAAIFGLLVLALYSACGESIDLRGLLVEPVQAATEQVAIADSLKLRFNQ